ncbi:dihydrodipicolinate synthase family protein [Microbispora sp. SCL1-1]|jgi:4-hydroxy-tetrahydrodipicolinate synthase|uniref:Dihydrodipicolinate synthase family protein n=1 Tax=Microbispora hainanensis TaxID=568844 RepID=A0ABZ1SFB8_9ACTN|nr:MULTISPECIES: dihydrodipicolinate synthase family protein [Microbispora]NJP26863.1 dihydrodipicolinate synthase family protein [Microbispora sp. CL1-1]TQS11784.1 dihydrodipicolinate synthase family protein [Microbispora sp. SCL1-1]
MDRDDVDWHGYWPAAPTPFTSSGELDEDALRALLRLYVRQGVHGVLVNGSTGEWFSQSPAERRRVAEIAASELSGRIPVVVGVTAYTAAEAAELARHAEAAGADGVLATPPPYAHLGAAEIHAFYAEVSTATELPFMVYNWPRGVAVDISAHPGLAERLADLDRVVAIKDSTGDWLRMLGTVEAVADRVRVFGSFLHRRGLAVLMEIGGDGNIDGGGIGAPFAVPFYEAVRKGDRETARVWADRYAALSSRLINPDYSGVYASPISQLKAAMAILGQPGGHVRPPLLEIADDDVISAIGAVLRESGLVSALEAEDGTEARR